MGRTVYYVNLADIKGGRPVFATFFACLIRINSAIIISGKLNLPL